MQNPMNFRLPDSDHTALKIKSLKEKRSIGEIVEKLLEDIVSGNRQIPLEDGEKMRPTSAIINADLREKFETYAHERGIPINKLLRLAIRDEVRSYR